MPMPMKREQPLDTMPWEHQKGETSKAWLAFHLYREMGSTRTLVRVSEVRGCHVTQIRRWSKFWNWQERVRQWNIFVDRQMADANVELLRETRQRHIRLSQMMLSKYMEKIAQVSAADIPIAILDRFLKAGTDVELRALGEATSRIESVVDINADAEQTLMGKLRQLSEGRSSEQAEVGEEAEEASDDNEDGEVPGISA